MPAWNPNLRSKTAIRSSDTRYYIDPSIAAAALGIGPNDLLNDLKTFGFLFETLCIRDLRVFADALNGRVPEYVDNFIELLTERGYIDRFSECADEFKLLYYAENGIAEAEVVSAVPLTDGEVNALRTKLEKLTGKRIELLFEIDPSVIGGLIVRVDGRVIDASVRKDLDNLRELMGKTAH